MEKHLFLIWNNSIKYKDQIINELSKKFQICFISQKNDILIKDNNNYDFLEEFYWNKYGEDNYKSRPRLTSNCIIIIVNDLKPKHIIYNTSQRGNIPVNENILKFKHYLRNKYDNSTFPLCHASDDVDEFIHNMKIIRKYASINNIDKLINYEIKYSELYKENKIQFYKGPFHELSNKNKNMWNNFIKYIHKNYTNHDMFCVESSFIMALYNIREACDLSFICEKNIQCDEPFIKNHNNIIENNSNLTKEDIIYDPKYHFYFFGIKCLNLSTLKMIKINRNTEKDKVDVKLINDFIN